MARLDGLRLDPVARALVALAMDWIVLLDREGTVLDASAPVFAGLCIDRGGLLGRSISTILAPDQPRFDIAAAADGNAVLERELSGPGGVRQPARLFFAPADAATVALRVEFEPSTKDLTRKELGQSEAKFRSLAESMPAAMFLLDPFDQDEPLRIMYANAWASKIYGYTNNEFIGHSITRLLDTPASAERAGVHAERIMQGEPLMFDAEQRHRDGKVLTIEVIAMLVPWGSTKAVLGLGADVTERRAAERALREQLKHSHTMEAVGHLAGGVSHEFNNVLTAIIGYAERAVRQLDPGSTLRNDLDQILKAAERATTLTRQLLVFSRHETVAPQALDMNAVVSDMVTLLRLTIGADIELRVTLDPSTGHVNIDKGYLELAVLNLCMNARDAMPRGGRLSIETAYDEVGVNAPGERTAVTAGRYVRLTISDTGCGMSPETLSHIFDPFFTTKPVDKGPGLGLSTVYGIVTGAGGHIQVESEPDGGSSFRIYLPSIDAPALASTSHAVPLNPPAEGETILLVDDNDLVRDIAQAVLEMEGYTVVVAAQGSDALTICADATRRIDLLVTDVIMPGMSGPELVERLASLRPGLKVLYVSGYRRADAMRRSELLSSNAFLQKPFTGELLVRKVREVLDSTAS